MDPRFDRIKSVHLAEKESNELTRIDNDFYRQLKEYIDEEEKRIKEYIETNDIQLDPKIIYSFKNLISLAKNIIAIRAEKVSRAAISDAFSSSSMPPENLVDWERKLYDSVRSIVEKAIGSITGSGGTSFNLVRVRILTDIALFVGPDLKEYGPFRAGEEVPLPKEVAELLKKKGQVEVIR